MQGYQKGKVIFNSWDDAETVTIQTHPSLNIVQVEPQYVTSINPEPDNNVTSSIVTHYSWVQQDIKVTLKLHDMPSFKQGFLIYDDYKWSFRPVPKINQKKIPSSPSTTSSTSLPISSSSNNYCKWWWDYYGEGRRGTTSGT